MGVHGKMSVRTISFAGTALLGQPCHACGSDGKGDAVMSEGQTHNEITGGVFSAVIQGRNISIQLPPEVIPASSWVPPASAAFCGREGELAILMRALAPPVESSQGKSAALGPVVTALTGLAGIGKTELVKQAARKALDSGWFPGGALFVDMFGYDEARRTEPAQALDGFLRALGIRPEHIPPEIEDRKRLYGSVLAEFARQGRRVLIVIDNVSSHEQAEPLLPGDLATAVLITSRDTLAMLSVRILDLDVLSDAEGIELLERVLAVARPGDTRTQDRAAADLVVRLCGGLPLALRIVAAILAADTARPLTVMATYLSDARSRLEELSYADTAVRAAFGLSYNRLDARQARLFRLLAINPGPDLSTATATQLAELDEPTARRTLDVLARAHLVEHAGVAGRWRLHDLVRLYADELSRLHSADDGRGAAFDRLLGYYLVTARGANAQLDASVADPSALGFPDRRQALIWLDSEYANLIAATHAAAEGEATMTVARDLPSAIFDFLLWRRHFDDWIKLSTPALTAARALGDLAAEGRALNCLGIALREVDRFKKTSRSEEAIVAHRDAIRIFRDIGDVNGEASALTNIGGALQEVQQFEEAVTVLREAVSVYRRIGQPWGEAKALLNLGLAHQRANNPGEAVILHQEAARIFQSMHDWWYCGQALNNLGSALRNTGKPLEAIAAHEGAAQIYRDHDTRWGSGQVLADMAPALWEVGRQQDAINAWKEAALIFRETGDEYHEKLVLVELEAR
jgi:tetratricopeptide (TPR) repeat protein